MTDRAQACRQRAQQCERAAPSLRERGRLPLGANCRSGLRVLVPPGLGCPLSQGRGFFHFIPIATRLDSNSEHLLEDERGGEEAEGATPGFSA